MDCILARYPKGLRKKLGAGLVEASPSEDLPKGRSLPWLLLLFLNFNLKFRIKKSSLRIVIRTRRPLVVGESLLDRLPFLNFIIAKRLASQLSCRRKPTRIRIKKSYSSLFLNFILNFRIKRSCSSP